METFKIRDLTFTYPGKEKPAVDGANLSVGFGEFIVLCGKSGCGKTTLLRNLKTVLAPHGTRAGSIYFYGRSIDEVGEREQASRIGFVLQSAENQIVTDKVWHELAFGLESLGYDNETIRIRTAEMASYFGIQTWFPKKVAELSGGQKQLLNLASVMVMQPDVLILDEPTSQLDPIAAADFLDTVKKINRDIGTTVILTEQRLEGAIPMADRVVVMDDGRIIADDIPGNVGAILSRKKHDMLISMPAPLQTYGALYEKNIGRDLECPLDVCGGRNYLTRLFSGRELRVTEMPPEKKKSASGEPAVEIKDAWFRYEKDSPDVIKDLSMNVARGEFFAIVGGNGTGKTTTLKIISGMEKAYRGRIKLFGKPIEKYDKKELRSGKVGLLPQDPQALFVENTVRKDLAEMLEDGGLGAEEISRRVEETAELVEIDKLLDSHPYDISGGEQQRAALAKILLLRPEILLLDEPTKGLDNLFKKKLAGVLRKLADSGVTVIMVSHDVEFCGKYTDRCAMFFDGGISTTDTPRKFFAGNSFYTTAANRMSRHIFSGAVTADDVTELVLKNFEAPEPGGGSGPSADSGGPDKNSDGISGKRVQQKNFDEARTRDLGKRNDLAEIRVTIGEHKEHKARNAVIAAFAFLFAAGTLWLSLRYQHSRGYYIVSMLLILYTQVPFFLSFERKKPHVREVMVIAVMVTLGVIGNGIFFMLPQVKPEIAIVIITGACLGARSGFVTGAMIPFVTNFMFGQGPWTPWQMFALGLIGFLAGLLFRKGLLKTNKIPLCIAGAVSAFLIYGLIVDVQTIFAATPTPSLAVALTVYGAALPMNAVLAVATVIFMAVLAKPLTEKIERVQFKYGLMEG